MWAEFKEKTYETYFLAEVARLTNILYSPDQTDEGALGFDGSFYLPLPPSRAIFPYIRFRRWRHLIGMSAGEIDDFGEELNSHLPPFRLNLFVQYKRPEWMHGSNATEWPSWSTSYFRYTIEAKQQGLLEGIVEAAAGRAAVVYAAAAFRLNSELFAHAEAGTVVPNSNIASVEMLTGHKRFTYTAPGSYGIAHSEPEALEGPSFDTILARMDDNEGLPFTKHLKLTAQSIEGAMGDDRGARDLWEASRRAIIGGDFADAYPRGRGTWVEAIVSIMAFAQAFDVRVSAVG
ncbi:hypothetical protein [Sphingobium fuliginis]|uniref:Uncharacterized protein n=1 Tax=Sphingobium fuliginis (strain ATCC 27551) TaxID=336203 RepID=A0A292Z9E3_SPHSA|nr:hypothetical protein [Sphingobium fuliginis]GAY19626.1 hypothetical protein SFOMI_0145 [Sphingobium fuliginis]